MKKLVIIGDKECINSNKINEFCNSCDLVIRLNTMHSAYYNTGNKCNIICACAGTFCYDVINRAKRFKKALSVVSMPSELWFWGNHSKRADEAITTFYNKDFKVTILDRVKDTYDMLEYIGYDVEEKSTDYIHSKQLIPTSLVFAIWNAVKLYGKEYKIYVTNCDIKNRDVLLHDIIHNPHNEHLYFLYKENLILNKLIQENKLEFISDF